jgi:GTP-binding protein
LGFEFLRHVERTRVLVHLVEPAPMDGTDPLENYRTIRHELAEYDAKLAGRPEIVVVTKAELPEAAEAQRRLEEELGHPVLVISAVTGQNLHKLIQQAWETLQTQPATTFETPAPPADDADHAGRTGQAAEPTAQADSDAEVGPGETPDAGAATDEADSVEE